jgi:hypothetical protein
LKKLILIYNSSNLKDEILFTALSTRLINLGPSPRRYGTPKGSRTATLRPKRRLNNLRLRDEA